jgi:hypothetical protein
MLGENKTYKPKLGSDNSTYHHYSVIGTATAWTIRRSNSGRGKRFSLLLNFQAGSQAHQASYSGGTGGFSPAVKRPRRETDLLPPSNVKVKNDGSYIFTPLYALVVCTGITTVFV